jgi:hypothetical protein
MVLTPPLPVLVAQLSCKYVSTSLHTQSLYVFFVPSRELIVMGRPFLSSNHEHLRARPCCTYPTFFQKHAYQPSDAWKGKRPQNQFFYEEAKAPSKDPNLLEDET